MQHNSVLITGAASGIGKDTARQLAAEGYTVYAAAPSVEKMDDLLEAGCIPLQLDVSKEDEITAAVDRICEEQGGVDILINNAGVRTQGSVEETALEDARHQFDVNLFGLARLTQLVLPQMRENRFGKIVNISSIGGKVYGPMGAWYIASKHALEGWSDCLRVEVKQFGIDVVVIEPGAIATEIDDATLTPMLRRSGFGPYRKIALRMAKFLRKTRKRASGSASPSVITKTISNALSATRPRTRYVAGKLARPMLFARKWLGDRNYDRLVGAMMG